MPVQNDAKDIFDNPIKTLNVGLPDMTFAIGVTDTGSYGN